MGQSTLEKRRNAKALAKLNKVEAELGRLPSSVAVQGAQKFQWTDGATIVVSIFAGLFLFALAMGYLIAPGGIFIALAYNAVKPRRTIALSGESVSIWNNSMWSGRVGDALGTYPRNALALGQWTTVAGHLPVKLKSEEVAALAAAQQQFGPVPPPAPPGFVPPPPAMANSLR